MIPKPKTITLTGKMMQAIYRHIVETMMKYEKVKVFSLGSFYIVERKPRKFHNIYTGKIEESKPKKTVIFRPSSTLLEKINN